MIKNIKMLTGKIGIFNTLDSHIPSKTGVDGVFAALSAKVAELVLRRMLTARLFVLRWCL